MESAGLGPHAAAVTPTPPGKPVDPAQSLRVLGVDPGPSVCGVVCVRGDLVDAHAIMKTEELIRGLAASNAVPWLGVDLLVIERVPTWGTLRPELRDTIEVYGRIVQAWLCGRLDAPASSSWLGIERPQVKKHLLGRTKGDDSEVRAAVIEHFGGEAARAKATKCPACKGRCTVRVPGTVRRTGCDACNQTGLFAPAGPLAGISSHEWAALAVALVGREIYRP